MVRFLAGSSRRRAGTDDRGSPAAAGEEEPTWTEVAKLAVSRRYFLSEDWKMGIAYMVS